MFAGQRQDALFSRIAGLARQAWRFPAMNVEDMNEGTSEFEQHVRALLNDSAERLPATVRSRLTQARFAALAPRPLWRRGLERSWAPAGAAAVLAVLLLVSPRGQNPAVSPLATA